MKIFEGIVRDGYGCATRHLDPIMELVESRTGLPNLKPGTLNVAICEEYIVRADAIICPDEYPLNKTSGLNETIKFQRCLVNGFKAIVMRPDTHETNPNVGHGKKHLELMSRIHFRTKFNLQNGDSVEVQLEGSDAWWNLGS